MFNKATHASFEADYRENPSLVQNKMKILNLKIYYS